ncbi:CobW family GTP-binding protein ['Paenibacillus yunnanensis' Narsing Rao et al. 2020]|uniref:CobW family GTP-binding protein n=1 Tax=Paenibacillus tengchongensis TaxID=2608684 RepID=UPI00124D1122|nr:CobW family GTP-binding protein [Paenibacillus tengchongensis]
MEIPVLILGGFLGSGKTTLLLSLLEESKARGLKPGVIMNELGARDVDGYILQEHTGVNVEKLLDGCVCCTRKDELPGSLNNLLARRPDLIFIELTGVADPAEIAEMLQTEAFARRLKLHYTVTLLDAEHALEYSSRFSADKQLVRTLRKQLSSADLIIVNKSDLAEQETLWKIEKTVRKVNSASEVVFTHYSRINLAPLLAGLTPQAPRSTAPQRGTAAAGGAPLKRIQAAPQPAATAVQEPPAGQQEPGGSGSYSQVSAVTLTFPQAGGSGIDPQRLESLFRVWGHVLLRAKGHVRLQGDAAVQLVQYAGNRTSWEPSRYPGQPYVVFIGLNLDEERLAEQWTALFG